MTDHVSSEDLLERARAGDIAAIDELMSRAETGDAEARPALASAYRSAGGAHVVGVTGPGGSGKSSLIRRLSAALRARGVKVAELTIGSPSPHGAEPLAADPVPTTDLADDIGLFVRSMTARGATGGLPRGLFEAVDVLDVAGYHTIFVETGSVGTDPGDIVEFAGTAIRVMEAVSVGTNPDAGSVDAEIADILVVSKADQPEAARTMADLVRVLEVGATAERDGVRPVPVVSTSAVTGEGIAGLMTVLQHHRTGLQGPAGEARRRRTAELRLTRTAEDILIERFREQRIATATGIASRVARREVDPYAAAVDALTVFMH